MGFIEDYKAAIRSQNVNCYKAFNFKYYNREGFTIPDDEEIEMRLKFGMLHEGNQEQKQDALAWLYDHGCLDVLKWA